MVWHQHFVRHHWLTSNIICKNISTTLSLYLSRAGSGSDVGTCISCTIGSLGHTKFELTSGEKRIKTYTSRMQVELDPLPIEPRGWRVAAKSKDARLNHNSGSSLSGERKRKISKIGAPDYKGLDSAHWDTFHRPLGSRPPRIQQRIQGLKLPRSCIRVRRVQTRRMHRQRRKGEIGVIRVYKSIKWLDRHQVTLAPKIPGCSPGALAIPPYLNWQLARNFARPMVSMNSFAPRILIV